MPDNNYKPVRVISLSLQLDNPHKLDISVEETDDAVLMTGEFAGVHLVNESRLPDLLFLSKKGVFIDHYDQTTVTKIDIHDLDVILPEIRDGVLIGAEMHFLDEGLDRTSIDDLTERMMRSLYEQAAHMLEAQAESVARFLHRLKMRADAMS